MRILFFNWRDINDPLAGGAEAYVHHIAAGLAMKNEVFFYCRRYKGSNHKDTLDGIRFVRHGGSYSLYLWAFFDYIFKLHRENFDVVVEDINGVPFLTPIFVRKPKVAIVHHIVGKEIFFKELPFPLAIVGWLSEKLIPFIYKKVTVVTVSPSTKEELIAFGISANRIRIVWSGREQQDRGAVKQSEKPLIIYLGRIKSYKQLDHLLYAFAKVIPHVPQAELGIAGRGDYDELERLAESLGIKQSVKFMGEVSEEQKYEILKRAWVFATTSIKEGWGLSVIEANYFGAPAVAYDVPGLRDSINDGETGLLVPAGDIEGLAKAIVRVLNDTELRERLSQNARSWASTFSYDRTAGEFAKVIEDVLSGK